MRASLLGSEDPIYAIVNSCDFVQGSLVAQRLERQRVKELVMYQTFILMLNKALEILKPIDELILKCKSDSVPIYVVLPNFHALPVHFKVLHTNNFITLKEM